MNLFFGRYQAARASKLHKANILETGRLKTSKSFYERTPAPRPSSRLLPPLPALERGAIFLSGAQHPASGTWPMVAGFLPAARPGPVPQQTVGPPVPAIGGHSFPHRTFGHFLCRTDAHLPGIPPASVPKSTGIQPRILHRLARCIGSRLPVVVRGRCPDRRSGGQGRVRMPGLFCPEIQKIYENHTGKIPGDLRQVAIISGPSYFFSGLY